MAKIDLKPLTLRDLQALKTRIETAIARHEKKSKTEALAKLKKQAKSLGFSLDDLVATKAKPAKKLPAKKAAPRAPMYRDPANAENTWIGRGPRPAWLRDALEAGKALEDFKIKD